MKKLSSLGAVIPQKIGVETRAKIGSLFIESKNVLRGLFRLGTYG